MRVLLVADLHYRLPQYDWLLSVAADFDVVVLAGDLCDVASAVDVGTQVVAVREVLAELAGRTRLVACSGNHDLDARNEAGEKTATWLGPLAGSGATVDGATALVDGVRFTALGWWDGPHARDALEAQLEAAAELADGPWVWAYHSPPTGPLSWTGQRHYGDPVLAGWIERFSPTAVLCGHIHQAPFTPDGDWLQVLGSTWLCNAGQQPGPVPAHVELDLGAGLATWRSYQGADERPLDLAGR